MDLTRIPAAAPELFQAEEVGVLPPQLAFPLAFLLQVVLPRDLRVVRRVVAAIVDRVADAIVDAAYQALCECERCRGGKETLGHAVDRIIGLGISEFSHNVAVAKD